MANSSIQTDLETGVRNRISAILEFFAVTPEITLSTEENVMTIDVRTGQDDLFTRGTADPLLALQHLLRIMMRHDFPEQTVTLSLNIGGFQQHQRARLAGVAKDAANQALATKMAVYLPSMSSYERRLVHLALVDEANVTSESEGEGEERRVVVKPKP